MNLKKKARDLLQAYRSDYLFGLGVLTQIGGIARRYGQRAMIISNTRHLKPEIEKIIRSLKKNEVNLAGGEVVPGAGVNTPREDVYRLQGYILHYKPDCIITIGGGSTIDASKVANVLACVGEYSPDIESYFGTGLVTKALEETGRKLLPVIAVQTVASSGAHLTKYANVTDPIVGQKKLIVDDAIIPSDPVFDYSITRTMPIELSIDGAMDGIAHCLEVFYGIKDEYYPLVKEIAETAIGLIVEQTQKVIDNPENMEAREAVGLATDLGGYAIMIGGTNGGHLTSFSLVDITSHGRACGILNPYYTVFFAPAIQPQLRVIGNIFKRTGFIKEDLNSLNGRELGIAVARGMINFSKSIGFPVKLSELSGFSDKHILRALEAAKNPQLAMKLRNMPIPLNANLIDRFMKPVLEAAKTGDFGLIKNME